MGQRETVVVTDDCDNHIIVTKNNVDLNDLQLVGDVLAGTGSFTLSTLLKIVLATPGTFSNPTLVVDNKGRITSITSGNTTAQITSQTFTVAIAATNQWVIALNAQILISITINGLDYSSQSAISAGVVTYTPGVGDYTTQVGDKVHIVWL